MKAPDTVYFTVGAASPPSAVPADPTAAGDDQDSVPAAVGASTTALARGATDNIVVKLISPGTPEVKVELVRD